MAVLGSTRKRGKPPGTATVNRGGRLWPLRRSPRPEESFGHKGIAAKAVLPDQSPRTKVLLASVVCTNLEGATDLEGAKNRRFPRNPLMHPHHSFTTSFLHGRPGREREICTGSSREKTKQGGTKWVYCMYRASRPGLIISYRQRRQGGMGEAGRERKREND